MTMWDNAHFFLFNLKEGEGYNDVICTKRTAKKIYLSNGLIVRYKKVNNFFYLTSSSVKVGHRSYDRINQILRDIEGFLIYKMHCNIW